MHSLRIQSESDGKSKGKRIIKQPMTSHQRSTLLNKCVAGIRLKVCYVMLYCIRFFVICANIFLIQWTRQKNNNNNNVGRLVKQVSFLLPICIWLNVGFLQNLTVPGLRKPDSLNDAANYLMIATKTTCVSLNSLNFCESLSMATYQQHLHCDDDTHISLSNQ